MTARTKTVSTHHAAREAEPAAAPPLPPASTKVVKQVDAELARDRGKRSISIDPDRLRPQHLTLRGAIDVDRSLLKPHAPDCLPGFLFLFDRGFTAFEAAVRAVHLAVPGQRIYSKATRTLAKEVVFPLFKQIRDYSGERLAHVPGAEDVRARLGVNSGYAADNPQEVLSGVESQLAVLQNPTWTPVLEEAGLFPDVWLEELTPLVQRLADSIHAGTTADTKLGDALGDQNDALLELDITLSRAATFLSTFGSPALAQKLEEAVPHKVAQKPPEVNPPAPAPPTPTPPAPTPSNGGTTPEAGGNGTPSAGGGTTPEGNAGGTPSPASEPLDGSHPGSAGTSTDGLENK